MKIVIISHSGYGNIIHCTPAAKILHKLGHDVTICAWPRSAGILQGIPFTKVTVNHPVQYTVDADHVIVSKAGAIWRDEWTRGEIHYAGPEHPPWDKHESRYYVDIVRQITGYKDPMPAPEIYIDKTNKLFVLNLIELHGLKNFICINASYLHYEHWRLKHFGNEKYSKLIDKLNQEGLQCVLMGTSDDSINAQDILNRFNLNTRTTEDGNRMNFNACGVFNHIKDAAAMIEQASLVVGNDGGLQHISATVGTPTLTIFTFTNPRKNRPFDATRPEFHKTVMKPCEERLMCQHGNWDKCKSTGCLDVPVDMVWDATKQILKDLRLGTSFKNDAAAEKYLPESKE